MALISRSLKIFTRICVSFGIFVGVGSLFSLALDKYRSRLPKEWLTQIFPGPSLENKNVPANLANDEEGAPPNVLLKVLHLIDYETYNLLMDRWFISSAKAFESSKWISHAELWGPGFPGWNDRDTITANVERRFDRPDYFDACMVYFNTDQARERTRQVLCHEKHLAAHDITKSIDLPRWYCQDHWIKELNEFSRSGEKGTILVDRPHELREDRRLQYYTETNISLVLAPYPAELERYNEIFGSRMLFVHQPHFVDTEIFFAHTGQESNEKREIDVVLAGCLEPADWYPLRNRLANLLEQSQLWQGLEVKHRKHPGYADLLWHEKARSRTASEQIEQVGSYAKDLANSKICLVTSSKWEYSIQKYTEAMAAGCLVIGNIPSDRSDVFSKHAIEISSQDTDDHILKTLKHWLDPKQIKERATKVEEAQKWVLENFSGKEYAEEVSKHITSALKGQRGFFMNGNEIHRVTDEESEVYSLSSRNSVVFIG